MSEPLLSHDETLHLIRDAQTGGEEALDTLVRRNTGLVKSIAVKFANRGADYEELFQIGSIGLIKAVRNYDESFGVRFSTYAVPLIMGEIKRFLRDDGMIKVSRATKEIGRRVEIISEQLRDKLGRDVTVNEVAQEIGIDPEEVSVAMEAMLTPISIYEPIFDEGGAPVLLLDRIPDDEDRLIEEKIMPKGMIRVLEPRERQLIVMRYFKDMTQSQIAEKMGISQVQVSRLESKILSEMRRRAAKPETAS